jgi:RHS repeat-associated protein
VPLGRHAGRPAHGNFGVESGKHLPSLTQLTTLALQNVGLTSATSFATFTNLTSLDLRYNAGLKLISPLAGLANLRSLYLYGTGVTDLAGLNSGGGSQAGSFTWVDLANQDPQVGKLASALTVTATALSVASWNASWPTVPFELQIDGEAVLVTAGFGTARLTVTRGAGGTIAAAHTVSSAAIMPSADVAVTPEGLAVALRHSLLAEYQWVYNNVSFQAYPGMLKGPAATLQTKAGNDWDQAGLLIQMLNDSGVKAQYSFGRVTLSMGAGSQIASWLGITDPTATLTYLADAGLNPVNNGSTVTFDHCTVSAWAPLTTGGYGWIALDPSIKSSSFKSGVSGVGASVPFSTSSYLSTPQTSTATGEDASPLQWYESQVQSFLKSSYPTKSLADVGYEGPIVQQSFASLPAIAYPVSVTTTLESDPVSGGGVNDATLALTNSGYLQTLNVTVTDVNSGASLLNQSLNLPQVSLKAIALTTAATVQLTVGNKTFAGGSPSGSVSSVQILLTTTLASTGTTLNSQVYKLSGNQDYAAIGVDAGQWSERALENVIRYASILEQQKFDGVTSTTNAEVEAVLQVIASQYLSSVDQQDAVTSNLLHAIVSRPSAVTALVSSDLSAANTSAELNLPFTTVPGDAAIDAPGGIGQVAVSLTNNATDAATVDQIDTLSQSRLEDEVAQSYTASPAISGASYFQTIAKTAATLKAKLYTFNSTTWNTALTKTTNTPYIYNANTAYPSIVNAITSELAVSGSTVDVWLQPYGSPANYYQLIGLAPPTGSIPLFYGWRENAGTSYTSYHVFGNVGSYSFLAGAGYLESSPPALPVTPGGNPDSNQTYTGGDVNVANGNVTVDATDLTLPGIGLPLTFSRHYDSQSVTNALTYGADNGLGLGWSFSYGDHLIMQSNGTIVASNGSVTWADSDGNQYTFVASGSSFTTPAPLIGNLTAVSGGGYSFRDRDGLIRQFDSNGRLIGVQDHDGNFQTITYGSNDYTTTQFQELANVADGNDASRYLTFVYNPSNGEISTITDFTGRTWTFAYTAWNDPTGFVHYLLSQVTAPAPYAGAPASAIPATSYVYYLDAAFGGLLQRATNADGDSTSYTYYPDRRSFQVISPDGGITTATYDLATLSSTFADAEGNVTAYYFNTSGDVVDTIHPDQSYQAAVWSGGLLQSDTDAFGNVESFGYDSYNDIVRTTDRLGYTSTSVYAYFASATTGPLVEITSTTDGDGHTTSYAYDAAGDLTRITDAAGGVTTMSYNARGEMLSETLPDGNVAGGNVAGYTTSYSYNSAGQVVVETRGLPATETYSYDAIGDLTVSTDADAHQTRYSYDFLGRRTSTTDAIGNTSLASYDTMGNVTSTVDPMGHQTSYTYDAAQQLIYTLAPNGSIASLVYSAAGDLLASADGLGRLTLYVYDTLNRNVQAVDPTGASTSKSYDGNGRVVATTDADGHTTTYGYDADGRRTSVTDALGNVTFSAYDAVGNLTSVTEPISSDTVTYSYDALNRRTTSTDALNDTTTVNYDADSNIIRTTDPRGDVTAYQYDVLDRRIATTDALATNNRETTQYDAAGNAIRSVDFDGNATTSTYDADNRLTAVTNALGYTSSKSYDGDGNVTSLTDFDGHTTHYAYDAVDRPTVVTDAMGAATTTTYDAAGEQVLVTDPLGRQTRIAYDADDRPIAVTDPTGAITRTAHDAAGNIILTTDALGRSSSIAYDADNRKVSATDALGDVVSLAYDANGNLTTLTDPNRNTTTYSYDADNRETVTSDPLGNTTTNGYDADANVVTVTDGRGNVTAYGYDSLNRRTSVTDAMQNKTQYLFDGQGNLLEMIDPAQTQPVTYAYDALNRRTTSTDALNEKTTAVYDAQGNVIAVIDADGNRKTTAYDADNRPTVVTDALGDTSTTNYDVVGEVASTVDQLGRTTVFTHDNDGRQTSVTDPAGNVTSSIYDLVGNAISVTNPLGETTTTSYDALNRPTTVTDPLGDATASTYDADGNLSTVTDADGNVTTYAYDGDNREVSVVDATGLPRLFAYDQVGDLVQQTDRDGRVTTYAYDADNRRTTEIWVGASYSITTSYNADSHVTASSDPDATYSYTYDGAGRVLTQTNAGTPISPTVQLTYGYDAAGNTLAVSDTINGVAAGVTTYGYDALNRETSVKQTGTGVVAKSVTFGYDADSELTSESRYGSATATGTPVMSAYTYDNDGRLATLAHTYGSSAISTYLWQYDAASQIIQETTPDASSVITYDADGQLLSATSTNPTLDPPQNYSYDATGNRANGGDVTGPGNELMSDGTYDYQYDGEGNLTQKTQILTGAVTTDTWDYRDRLAEVVSTTSAGVVTQDVKYTYDAYNRRIGKSVSVNGGTPVVSRYIYDGDNLILQFDGSGTQTHRYLNGPGTDNVLADEQGTGSAGGTLVWLLGDNQGTTRDLVSSTGSVLNHISYDSFGNVTNQTHPLVVTLFGYTGQQADAETGLNYDRARYYDPQSARFLSQDPIGFASHDDNLYRYTFNSPLDGQDPTGNGFFSSIFKDIKHIVHSVAKDVGSVAHEIVSGVTDVVRDVAGAVEHVGEGVYDAVSGVVVAATSSIEAGLTGGSVLNAFDDSLKNAGGKVLNQLGDAASNVEGVLSVAGHQLGVAIGIIQDASGGLNLNALLTQGKIEFSAPLVNLFSESLDARFKSTAYDQLGGVALQVALAAATGGSSLALTAGEIGVASTVLLDNTGLGKSVLGRDAVGVGGSFISGGFSGGIETAGLDTLGRVDPQLGQIVGAYNQVEGLYSEIANMSLISTQASSASLSSNSAQLGGGSPPNDELGEAIGSLITGDYDESNSSIDGSDASQSFPGSLHVIVPVGQYRNYESDGEHVDASSMLERFDSVNQFGEEINDILGPEGMKVVSKDLFEFADHLGTAGDVAVMLGNIASSPDQLSAAKEGITTFADGMLIAEPVTTASEEVGAATGAIIGGLLFPPGGEIVGGVIGGFVGGSLGFVKANQAASNMGGAISEVGVSDVEI